MKIKNKQEPKYQIWCNRGNGLELDGCWGSENAAFVSKKEAEKTCVELKKQYPDCEFIVCDIVPNKDKGMSENDLYKTRWKSIYRT